MTCHVWHNLAMSKPSSQISSPTILFLSPPPPPSPPAPTSTITITVTDGDSTIHCTPHHLSLPLCHLTASTTPYLHCLCIMPHHLSLFHLNPAIVTITLLLPIPLATAIIATMSLRPHLIQHYLYCLQVSTWQPRHHTTDQNHPRQPQLSSHHWLCHLCQQHPHAYQPASGPTHPHLLPFHHEERGSGYGHITHNDANQDGLATLEWVPPVNTMNTY